MNICIRYRGDKNRHTSPLIIPANLRSEICISILYPNYIISLKFSCDTRRVSATAILYASFLVLQNYVHMNISAVLYKLFNFIQVYKCELNTKFRQFFPAILFGNQPLLCSL